MTTETITQPVDAAPAPAPAVVEPPAPETPAAPERIPGFTVGETTYTFPAHVPVGWALTYLRLFYSTGEDHALIWALAKLLGDKQVNQLEADPALTREALAEATAAIRRVLLGELEDPKGS